MNRERTRYGGVSALPRTMLKQSTIVLGALVHWQPLLRPTPRHGDAARHSARPVRVGVALVDFGTKIWSAHATIRRSTRRAHFRTAPLQRRGFVASRRPSPPSRGAEQPRSSRSPITNVPHPRHPRSCSLRRERNGDGPSPAGPHAFKGVKAKTRHRRSAVATQTRARWNDLLMTDKAAAFRGAIDRRGAERATNPTDRLLHQIDDLRRRTLTPAAAEHAL